MAKKFKQEHRSWPTKLKTAAVSVVRGVRGQSSFYVHFAFAAIAIVAACLLRIDRHDWSLLVVAITLVLVTEMMNRSIELLSRAITDEENEWIRDSLDIASGAVLLAAIGSVVLGILIFAEKIVQLLVSG